MQEPQKILFVCFADSVHSQSWINLLQDSNFDLRVFAYPVDFGNKYPPIPWLYPTYSIFKPTSNRNISQTHWLFPSYAWSRFMLNPLAYRSRLPAKWLEAIIRRWKPDLIHNLSFVFGADITWKVLKNLPKETRPKWVISSWGSDMTVRLEDPVLKKRLSEQIQECDGFIADCERDIRHAKALGLPKRKLPGELPIPGTGGIDLDDCVVVPQDLDQRRLIIVPKAYDNRANKTIPILDALRLCEDAIGGYQIYFLMSSEDVRANVERLPLYIRERCICLLHIPKQDLFRLYSQARVMIAPSVSDGTPNVMLEAMALGALPIMSPIMSIQEWISDGENGLLAHAQDPVQIAQALRRALSDDDLCNRAAQRNRRIIAERANRKLIRTDVVRFYHQILSQNG